MYRRIFFVFLTIGILVGCLGFLAQACSAQESRGQGYVLVGPGGISPHGVGATLFVGGGGEGFITKGFSLGGEVGGLAGLAHGGGGIGFLSVGPAYHFNRAKGNRVSPFITGGYSLGFNGSGHSSMVHFGGGANIWMTQKLGLRLDFRDIYDPHKFEKVHYLNFRIGLTFR